MTTQIKQMLTKIGHDYLVKRVKTMGDNFNHVWIRSEGVVVVLLPGFAIIW